ncbi:NTF2-like protein [Microthyrium microscopicum]|uniref:NTF2-like protein n=1 Tax=Microthyrium microscopicum TaxID=703497 RepID=A0A6A6U1U2_9PEZI|nr:NTF2-like protein [Microthyrium microscopicum]
MPFEIYIPTTLTFPTYIAILQTARTWADGYDLKDHARLLASLAPTVSIDYTQIVAAWGLKTYSANEFADLWLSAEHLGLTPLATQHLLATPYFKKVTEEEIVVQWQQLASHGRRREPRKEGEEAKEGEEEIVETSDGRSYMEHQYVKVEGLWKIAKITPSLLYTTGDFMRIRRPEGEA